MRTNQMLASRLLTYTFAVFLLCIGTDKIVQTNLITDWQSLVGPVVHFLLPVDLGTIVMLEGVIELLLGVFLLTRWKAITLFVLMFTIAIVATDLLILRYNNLAIREVILIVVCFAMYLLDERTPEFWQIKTGAQT